MGQSVGAHHAIRYRNVTECKPGTYPRPSQRTWKELLGFRVLAELADDRVQVDFAASYRLHQRIDIRQSIMTSKLVEDVSNFRVVVASLFQPVDHGLQSRIGIS